MNRERRKKELSIFFSRRWAMSATAFAELREQLFSLYSSEKFAEAYELVSRAEPQLPEHVERLLYWQACLACRTGNNELALAHLRDLLAKGYGYTPEYLLRDDDFAPLRGNPAFEEVLAASRTQFEAG